MYDGDEDHTWAVIPNKGPLAGEALARGVGGHNFLI